MKREQLVLFSRTFFLSSIIHVTISKCVKNKQLPRSYCLFYQIWKKKITKDSPAEDANIKISIYDLVHVLPCLVTTSHFFVKFRLNMSVLFATVPCAPRCRRNADIDSVKCVWKSPLHGKVMLI